MPNTVAQHFDLDNPNKRQAERKAAPREVKKRDGQPTSGKHAKKENKGGNEMNAPKAAGNKK